MFQSVNDTKMYGIKPVDAKGNLAKIDGAPNWAITDASLATINPSADGMTCEVVPSGSLGACKLQVVGDADMTEGRKEIFGEMDLEFVAGEAVRIEISAL